MTNGLVRVALAVFLPAFVAFLSTVGASGPLGLTAGLAVAMVAAAVLVQLAPPVVPALIHTVSLREIAWQAAFLRLRDPDAKGRTRPRAPGSRSTAA